MRSARRAHAGDADAIAALLAAAGARLAEQGFRNWVPAYPVERVRSDIADREVWVVSDGAAIVAAYTLAPAPVRPYDPAPWPDPTAPALYLNRLAVDPSRQGTGLGGWCLDAVAERAREVGVHAVRCDVLRENEALRRFYERRRYVAYGERTHSGWTFVCYERGVERSGVSFGT